MTRTALVISVIPGGLETANPEALIENPFRDSGLGVARRPGMTD
jgi:hypothetical protein